MILRHPTAGYWIHLFVQLEMDAVIEELDLAEMETMYIMKIAKETVQELQKTPDCDANKLQALSEAYITLVQRVSSKIKKSSSILESKNEP